MHMYNFIHILACVTIFNNVYAIQLKGQQTLTSGEEVQMMRLYEFAPKYLRCDGSGYMPPPSTSSDQYRPPRP